MVLARSGRGPEALQYVWCANIDSEPSLHCLPMALSRSNAPSILPCFHRHTFYVVQSQLSYHPCSVHLPVTRQTIIVSLAEV
jgi:hypothetical protein